MMTNADRTAKCRRLRIWSEGLHTAEVLRAANVDELREKVAALEAELDADSSEREAAGLTGDMSGWPDASSQYIRIGKKEWID